MAGNRSITVTLRANVSDFKNQFDAATRAVESTSKATEDAGKRSDSAMGQMVQSAQKNREAWSTAGAALTGFGAVALGGLGLATKAAMDWESAWAGVAKTVDGTPEQMAALETSLRGLARELPASHQEIAAVAEAAGQLGVAREDIVSFTRTMINLGEATNLSADEAATSIAQFTNVMGTSADDVDNLGSSLVALGNDGASTERDIMFMAQRLSGAGALIGASEQDILGLSSALASVGITAEAGGGALSRVLQKMNTEVLDGGDKLEKFAEVAGVSAEEFAAKWRQSPIEAFDLFTQGLNGVTASGGNAVGVLSELGIKSTEETRAILSLAGAGDLLGDSLDTSNQAWAENMALTKEVERRYETAESRIKLARNALVDAGISIGGVVLPAVAQLADGVAKAAGWFADLPAPVHAAVAALGGVAGAGSLAAGSFLLIFPRVMDTVSAFRTLRNDMPELTSRMGRAAVNVGKLGLAFAALSAVPGMLKTITDASRGIDRDSFDIGANELTASLLEASDSASVFDATMGDLYDSGAINKKMFGDLGTSIENVANMNVAERFASWSHLDASGISDVKQRFDDLGKSLAVMAQSDLPKAQQSFSGFWAEAKAGGASFADVMAVMPAFKDELVGLATQMGVGTDDTTLLKIATGQLKPVVDETTGAVSGYTEGVEGAADATADAAKAAEDALDAFLDLHNEFIDGERAAMDYADAVKEVGKAASENGKHWDDGTKAAAENKRAILDLADQALKTADAFKADNKSGTFLKQARQDIIDTMVDMGAGREEAERYADQLVGTPTEIQTIIDLETQAAQDKWGALYAELWPEGGHPPMVLDVDADTSKASEKTEQFTGTVMNGPPVDQKVGADTTSAAQGLYGFQETVEGTTATAPVDADTSMAQSALLTQLQEVENSGGSITIDGNPVSAEQALFQIMAQADGSTGTMSIDGNNSPALGELSGTVTVINNADGTVTIKGNSDPAESALSTVKNAIDAAAGIIDIQGDNSSANASTDAAKSKADNTSGTMGIKGNNSAAQNSLSNVLGSVNRSHGTMGINGNASGARNATQGAVGYANRSRGSIKVSALTDAANSAISNAARSRTAYIHVVASGVSAAIGVISRAVNHRAAGGPINGPGTGTSDSIPAMLSNGEHVWTAAEVAALGGHQAMYSLRARALAGERFAVGGAVDDPLPYRQQARNWAPDHSMASSRAQTAASIGAGAGAAMTYAPTINGPDAQQVSELSFGKFQHWTQTQSTGHHP